MTAQQEALTAKAQGEKDLVEIEYQQKQEQTKQVVEAETKVKVAQQDLEQQKIQFTAATFEAKKKVTLADASAYEKKTTIQADGALELKLNALVNIQKSWADAFSKYQGNIVPMYQTGNGGTGNGAVSFMELMTAKTAKRSCS